MSAQRSPNIGVKTLEPLNLYVHLPTCTCTPNMPQYKVSSSTATESLVRESLLDPCIVLHFFLTDAGDQLA